MSTARELIDQNTLMVFSKSYCPYCKKVKSLFQELGYLSKAKVVELDEIKTGSQLQSEMAKICGKSSVPQVFIKGVSIGGCDDTHLLHKKGIFLFYFYFHFLFIFLLFIFILFDFF